MMLHLPILPLLIPLLSGILLLLPPFNQHDQRSRWFAIVSSAMMVVVSAYLLWTVDQSGALVYALGGWQPPFGIMLVADRMAVLLVLLTSVLLFCVLLYGSAGEDKKGRFFQSLVMFQVLGIQGAFLTGDIFNLFVFFEVLLIASYALLIHGGGKAKTLANLHYVSLNLVGSALFLFALGMIYGTFGTLNMADMQTKAAFISADDVVLAKSGALLLLVVFGLKSAMLPLHFWLPRAYAAAPAPIAALFAIMTKVGLYSLWRVHGAIFGEHAGDLALVAHDWLWPLAWLTLVVGIVATLASQTLRMLSANLVLVSVGGLLLMVALNTPLATAAGLYYVLHSTLASAALFLLAGMVVEQRGKAEDRFVPSRPVAQPVLLSGLFFVIALAMIGMPPLSGFIGKTAMLQAALQGNMAHWIWPPLLLASLAALVMLSRAGSTLFWRSKGDRPSSLKAHPLQVLSVTLLLLCLPLLVIFAGPIMAYCLAAAEDLYRGLNLLQIMSEQGLPHD
ncbi:MAG: monovalent cation/H+ antiporter subunit D [Bacterioplanes sp.]|nr:monovalent cation/H+ antiporter subunit D [Bacterioplanes sp.]